LANDCYSSMFYGCRGLTTAPDLPATTLNPSCYYRMFYGCTGLITAPELPATTLTIKCYSQMFVNCSSLNYIKMLATNISASNCLSGWVSGVAATGTFVKNSAATWDVTGISGVPSGWTVLTAIPTPEAVDLGLPSGVKWASFNLGASKPEEYGDYYAWGEIEPYYEPGYALADMPIWKTGKESGYYWSSYKLCMGTIYTITKYCTDSTSGYNGFKDGKTVLNPDDDAAHVNLGGYWRMPTDAEWTELLSKCTWESTSMNGISGQKVTGPNGNSIFLPSAGLRNGTHRSDAGSLVYYWSSTLHSDYSFEAWVISSFPDYVIKSHADRCAGLSIRPVRL